MVPEIWLMYGRMMEPRKTFGFLPSFERLSEKDLTRRHGADIGCAGLPKNAMF
jgi:hypothetical protein